MVIFLAPQANVSQQHTTIQRLIQYLKSHLQFWLKKKQPVLMLLLKHCLIQTHFTSASFFSNLQTFTMATCCTVSSLFTSASMKSREITFGSHETLHYIYIKEKLQKCLCVCVSVNYSP